MLRHRKKWILGSSNKSHSRHQENLEKNVKYTESEREAHTPILLHMVTSSSPTVLESSTMIVLIAPSSILIFCGLCFFLYSKTSCEKSRQRTDKTTVRRNESVYFFLGTVRMTLPHFGACSSLAYDQIPTRCLSSGRHLTRTGHNLKLKHRWGRAINISQLSCFHHARVLDGYKDLWTRLHVADETNKTKGVSHWNKMISATDSDETCLCVDEQNPPWLEKANHISRTAHAWYKSDLESNNSIESEETETVLLSQRQGETLQTSVNTELLVFDFQAVWLLEWRKIREEEEEIFRQGE